MGEDYKAVVAMIGMQCVYAALALFTRPVLVQGTSPRVFVVYRNAIATLLLAPFACLSRWRNPCRTSLGLKGFSLIFLSSLIGVTANQNAYFEGLYLSSSTITNAMANLVPAITFVLATVVGFEKVNVRSLRSNAKIIGTIICVGGAIYMTFIKGTKLLNTQLPIPPKSHLGLAGQNLTLGCLFFIVNTCCASFWVIQQVPISARCPDHFYTAFWMGLLGTIQSAIVTLILEHDLKYGIYIQLLKLQVVYLHLVGGVAVVIGLYIVLWGKAKDQQKTKQETDPNQSRTVDQVLIDDDSTEKTSCKIDLKEPLLKKEKSRFI